MSVERTTAPSTPALTGDAPASNGDRRAELARLAQEFESLLLANMLRDMRSAGRWSEEDSNDTLGAGAFNQTFDTELARSLSQAGGFGLSSFLLKAFDRYAESTAASTVESAWATTKRAVVTPEPSLPSSPAPSSPAPFPPAPSSPASSPLPPGHVTSAFGWRKDPLTGAMAFHRGVDLKAAEGDPVAATAPGRVVFSGQNGGYGTSVVVEHANGVKTRYAHLSATLVSAGDQVQEGQLIGRVGHTGRATGAHLHYEVIAGDQAVDPLR